MQTFAAIPVFRRVYKYVSAVNTGKKETAMKEIKIMNNNTLKLNMSEMEQVNGAGDIIDGIGKGAIAGMAGGAFIGALVGFLLFNAYPAKLFLGDTGSLAIGGFVAMYAILMQMPLYILIVAFIYVIELVSTIIQVQYFRHTGGKRFFRMAPIHHHYEKGGWSEVRIVTVFSVVTLVLACICLLPIL